MSESTMTINKLGNRIWKNRAGEYHRIDGHAVEWTDGTKFWYKNGLIHRIDGHAVEWTDGTKFWYKNGLIHRIDGPAVEWDNGDVTWYIQNDFLGSNIHGFWALWDILNDEERQNVNLHMWLRKLTNV